jgi:hypothetical protein
MACHPARVDFAFDQVTQVQRVALCELPQPARTQGVHRTIEHLFDQTRDFWQR